MNKINLIGKYVGPKQIVNFRDVERKTYLGRDVVEIEFADKIKREYPLEDLVAIAIKEETDLSSLQLTELKITASKILGVLIDSELPISDPTRANIQYLLQTVLPESIKESEHLVYGKIFNKDYEAITLLDLDRVLKQKLPKKKT